MRRIISLFLILFCGVAYAAIPLTDEAVSHLDKKYLYGCIGPNRFDCSGFVYYCVKESYGIELKRTAQEQGYDDIYEKIEKIADLQEGDLVYFNTVRDNDLCDHAGIYLGNNEFIHCSSSAHKVVVSKLCGSYYEKKFSWGRRINIE